MATKTRPKVEGGEGSPLATTPQGGASATPLSGGHPRNAPAKSAHPLFAIPEHWESLSLGEACRMGGGDIQTGPFGSQLHAADYVPVGIPSIMPQNIGDNRINENGIARIKSEDARRLSRYLTKTGDVVYSRRGDVERRALIREKENGWLCGTGCLRVRFGEGRIDPSYASFYLGHPVVREWIVRHAHGATMPNLNTSILSALPFALPPLEEQRAISRLLGALDDKTENNRRMNETLEAMARALFQDWFVDFGPVRAKMEGQEPPGLSNDLKDFFPDELGDNDIPAGWTIKKLGDFARQVGTTVQASELSDDDPYFGLEHLPRKSIALDTWGYAGEVESGKRRFPAGCILFGKLRPYFHKVGIAPISGVCSTDILSLAPIIPDDFAFSLSIVSSDTFIAFASRIADGAKMPRVNWKDLAEYLVPAPPKPLTAAFNQLTKPYYETIVSHIRENRTLISLRDSLLPKLLSGELRIPDAERLVGQAL